MIPSSMNELGPFVPTAAQRSQLAALRDLDETLKAVREWHEKQMILFILKEDDSLKSARTKGIWQGFVYAFELLEKLSSPRPIAEEVEEKDFFAGR